MKNCLRDVEQADKLWEIYTKLLAIRRYMLMRWLECASVGWLPHDIPNDKVKPLRQNWN